MKQQEIIERLERIEALIKSGNDKPMNFEETAKYLGFSHSYLYSLTAKKIIRCYKPTGKVLFFSKKELDDWIFSRTKDKEKLE